MSLSRNSFGTKLLAMLLIFTIDFIFFANWFNINQQDVQESIVLSQTTLPKLLLHTKETIPNRTKQIASLQNPTQNINNIKRITNPSIPALLIIGPSKTATSSLVTQLSYIFPHWIHASTITSENKTIPLEFGKLNGWTYRHLIGNESAYKHYMNKLEHYHSNTIKNHTDLMSFNNEPNIFEIRGSYIWYLSKQLKNRTAFKYDHDYFIIKKPSYFYIPHVSYLTAISLSVKHDIMPSFKLPLGNNPIQSFGTKILCLLRNPIERVHSYYDMHRGTVQEFNEFNNTLQDKQILYLRNLIVESDDETVILIEFMKYVYEFSRNWFEMDPLGHKAFPLLTPEFIVISSFYLPQFMFWINIYNELHLLESHFKFMQFGYLVNEETTYDALLTLRCWVELNLNENDKDLCYKYYHKTKMNHYKMKRTFHFAKQFDQELLYLLTEFYKPIQIKLHQLFSKYKKTLFLGPNFNDEILW